MVEFGALSFSLGLDLDPYSGVVDVERDASFPAPTFRILESDDDGDDFNLDSLDAGQHGEEDPPRRALKHLKRGAAVTPSSALPLLQSVQAPNIEEFSSDDDDPHLGCLGSEGGPDVGGEGIVIGFIDTGIDPTHPSFSSKTSGNSYPVPDHFMGICEVTKEFPSGSCNRKLIGARHFAASAITWGIFNASQDYASRFDGDGHGTHTASIAAGTM